MPVVVISSRSTDAQFLAKVATPVQEACALVEVGFEYVTGEYNDGGKIFRKRNEQKLVNKAKSWVNSRLSTF